MNRSHSVKRCEKAYQIPASMQTLDLQELGSYPGTSARGGKMARIKRLVCMLLSSKTSRRLASRLCRCASRRCRI